MCPAAARKKVDTYELTTTWKFDAPRDDVFKAWTKSRHIINWWVPEGFTMPAHKMDIHPGGMYQCDLKDPDGNEHWAIGVFTEMVEPSHLAFTHSWKEDGNLSPETHVAVELMEKDGGTEMVFFQSGFETQPECENHQKGWQESFIRLEKYLESQNDL